MWRTVAAAAGPSRLQLLQPAAPRQLAVHARGLAKKAKRKDGSLPEWDKLISPLEPRGVNFNLPSLQSLKLTHSTEGAGQTGARKFKAVMPQLRWHNPQASITQEWNCKPEGNASHKPRPNPFPKDEIVPPKLLLTLEGETEQMEDVSGMRVEDILALVMRKAGADEFDVDKAVDWAKEHMRGRLPTPKPHEWRRTYDEVPADSGAEAALAEGLGIPPDDADAAGGWDGGAEAKL